MFKLVRIGLDLVLQTKMISGKTPCRVSPMVANHLAYQVPVKLDRWWCEMSSLISVNYKNNELAINVPFEMRRSKRRRKR